MDPGEPARRTPAQRLGDTAEEKVVADLASRNWDILGRNVRIGRYELDVVAIDPGPPAALVMVEVRWRASRCFGLPEETVDHRKRTRLRAGAYCLLDRGTFADGAAVPSLPLRFDIVVVEPDGRMRHHRAAF